MLDTAASDEENVDIDMDIIAVDSAASDEEDDDIVDIDNIAVDSAAAAENMDIIVSDGGATIDVDTHICSECGKIFLKKKYLRAHMKK